MEDNKKNSIDPQPEHGKDDKGHNGNGNQGGNGNNNSNGNNGNHNGWDKKQTTSHGLIWKWTE